MTTATEPTIGSLFTGAGALDMGVQAVFGGRVAWHCQYEPPDKHGRPDKHQYAAQILAHRWPGVPNLGDITAVHWDQVEPVDILTGGFPCTDVSLAGQRAGLTEGTRSGLWSHMARAIEALQPRMVVIENVEGLLSADAHGDLEPCPWCLGDRGDEPVLRALGCVLGDLAGLGFDAEWQIVRASDVGAPHQRKRVIVLAWPAHATGEGCEGTGLPGRPAEHSAVAADAADLGHERLGDARDGWAGPADGGVAAPDADGRRCEGHPQRHCGQNDGQPERQPRLDAVGRHLQWATPADADRSGQRPNERDVQPGQSDVAWGPYAPAIARWERILGRPAPRPTDDLGRLNPIFVEWMQGWPAGHVTGVPGLPRTAQLKALGNGVVPQQAEAALRLLAARAAR